MTKLSAIASTASSVLAGRVFQAVKNLASEGQPGKVHAAAKYAFGTESMSEAGQQNLRSVADHVRSELKRVALAEGITPTEGQISAATESMLMASNVQDSIRRNAVVEGNGSTPFVGTSGLADGFAGRTIGAEAYNESDNTNVLANTVTYNILAGRQNKAGELLFPTVTVPSDNVGVSVTIRLYQVHDDIKRQISGARANFNRRSIHRGMIDHTILHNDSTMAIPVHRTESAANFTTDVAAYDTVNEGETIHTGALRFGRTVDFIGLSQTDTLLASGVMTREDDLDPDVRLKAVYLKVGANVVRFAVENLALSNFIATGQDNYRSQKLNFETSSLVLQKTTKTIAGAALAGDLATIDTGNLVVRLGVVVNGSVNIESGDLVAHANGLTVLSIYDADDKSQVPTDAGAGQTLKNAIEAGTLVGYDVKAYRSNASRRQRGQLLDTTFYTQIWAVPYRSPLTALRPVNAPAQSDGADLEALASATFIRTSSEAITVLLETAEVLSATSALDLDPTAIPETLGVARMLLKPTYLAGNINIAAETNAVKSHELEKDIRAVLVNRIRDLAYRLYRDSEFQAVVESGASGTTDEPVVCVVTDPMTARYLMIEGEVRTAGPGFDLRIETTPDERMQGRIAVALGYPDKSDGAVNSLHFGNMLWSPELALVLPIARDGKISKELTVQPRFRHIVNTPVLGMLSVTGLPEVVSVRVPIAFKEVI